ncbi:MAG TPA: hypothetical protein VMT16_04475 [Thermoanaerobaculia bacterium]|nr:hypothetical protein [Thermoanaerobaculia bacterium]
MTTGAVGLQPAQVVSQAQKLVDQTPKQLQEFEQVLAQLQQQGQGGMVQQAAQQPQVVGPEKMEGLYAQKMDEAKAPGGVEKLLGEVEAGYKELNALLQQIDGGRTFSPQELLGLQAQIHQVSLQVDTTTKVVGEVVSSVKQLMQQQI